MGLFLMLKYSLFFYMIAGSKKVEFLQSVNNDGNKNILKILPL